MIIYRRAVLLIHGFAGGTYDQEKLANFLERNSRLDVYSFTLPGHDKRSFKKSNYEDWINESDNQLKKIIGYGYSQIYIVGHSMGGVIACILANKYSIVKKLVLAAPSFNYIALDDSSKLEKVKNGVLAIRNNDKDEILTRFLKLPLGSIGEFMKLVEDNKDVYCDINIPTYVLQGDADTLVPMQSSINLYNSIKSKRKKIDVLNNVTHDIFRECDEVVYKNVERFLLK